MQYASYFSLLSRHLESIIVAGGYPFLFLAVFLEGLPLVGTAIPGHVAIIAGGFLARVGVLNLWAVLVLAVLGAVGGDYVGFILGRRYGLSLIDRLRPYFFLSDSQLEKARVLLAKHTGKAMIIGRFSPVTRAIMPFLVGAGNTSSRKFWLFNMIGGISWAVISVLIGYAFGVGYDIFSGSVGRFVLLALAIAVVILWGYRFVNMRFHVFKRYELFALGLNLLSLWVLAVTAEDAWSVHSSLANFDVAGNLFMAGHVTPVIVQAATWVSSVGSSTVTGLIGVAIGGWFLFREKWRSGAIMLMSVGSTGVFVVMMKEFFMRARPENALQTLSDPSFPSGHAAMAAAFFVIVVYLFAPHVRSWVARELAIVACVLVVILIGVSRVALNVHWSSDVIAGWSLGIFCASASILLVRYVGSLFIRKAP